MVDLFELRQLVTSFVVFSLEWPERDEPVAYRRPHLLIWFCHFLVTSLEFVFHACLFLYRCYI